MPVALELGVTDVYEVATSAFQIEGNRRGDEFDIHCPNPQHLDSKPSCSVNMTTGLWKCLACGVAGDLIKLGMLCLDEDYEYIYELLRPNSLDAFRNLIHAKLVQSTMTETEKIKRKLPGPYEDGPFNELLQRGFTEQTCRRWGVRFVPMQSLQGKEHEFTITNSLGIPIRDHRRHLLAWCYRRTVDSASWQPRYLYTPEIALSELWYGLQHHANKQHIVVVEGALDAMWLDQSGYPALALLGSQMGKNKLNYLKNYQKVTLFGDRDIAGIQAVQRIGAVIGDHTAVRVARYSPAAIRAAQAGDPKKKVDPQALPPVHLERAIENALPWSMWLRSIKT